MITFKEIQEGIDTQENEYLYEAPQQQDAEQPQIDPMMMKQKAAEFVSRCFAARNAMHFFHLTTTSHAAHVASNDFYEDIIPVTDKFAEIIAGRIGKFDAFPPVNEKSPDGLQIVGNLTKFIDVIRQIFPYNEVQNVIDEILGVCNKAAYKLRDLR